MYLKSIEVYGFKSFANKITFQFHNGITGIVGPNGSGKSNVADAVRWVLGEQRIKQLRGASMQDVIFAGTELRKPMSYASVAITIDNADHQLPIDYTEVTVMRRLYRSGESEYLLNGVQCRLRDINELFYDTGIGKEGYSIIGQGQIDRILSGKPEDRRELFDEAAGIVKFKRRKETAQKKLDNERQDLLRVNDILSELEKRLPSLQKQSDTARTFLKLREELKKCDVNAFLLDLARLKEETAQVEEQISIAEAQTKEAQAAYARAKERYEEIEAQMAKTDALLEEKRNSQTQCSVLKEQLEGRLTLLHEQIRAAKANDEATLERLSQLAGTIDEKSAQKEACREEREAQLRIHGAVMEKQEAQQEAFALLQQALEETEARLEENRTEQLKLLHAHADLQAGRQKYETMMEQTAVHRAEIRQRFVSLQTSEAAYQESLQASEETLSRIEAQIQNAAQEEAALAQKLIQQRQSLAQKSEQLAKRQQLYMQQRSRLDSLTNLTERYEGYGNSIRRVMEQKEKTPGIVGVVADIIKTEKKYETAIETALGGSIQNIVTTDEQTAKQMISFLKENKLGRATFLPLTNIRMGGAQTPKEALQKRGVIGIAASLVRTDEAYKIVKEYLLGRIFVVDTMENALALAGAYRQTLRIVTLEGELLNPGGSITGGAFKNKSNLLGRRRELGELNRQVKALAEETASLAQEIEAQKQARDALRRQQEKEKEQLQKLYLRQNTAKLHLGQERSAYTSVKEEFQKIEKEKASADLQIEAIKAQQEKISRDTQALEARQKTLEEELLTGQKQTEAQRQEQEASMQQAAAYQAELAASSEKLSAAEQNLARLDAELAALQAEKELLGTNAQDAKQDVRSRERTRAQVEAQISDARQENDRIAQEIAALQKQKEAFSERNRTFFAQREELSEKLSMLDRESYRLSNQKERLEEARSTQINYMWEEYELSPSSAQEQRDESLLDLPMLRKRCKTLRAQMKALGTVNVNAIEEYKETEERCTFMCAQRDDLAEAEKTLLSIINELDTGMRKQFAERFEQIKQEFDKAFKALFGGGKGTLALVEDADVLNAGIQIIAQPPGKKLQNMMQLSGGEKALTAIALLFAIQNLKPSPFCLLDEIEAALDDSNVGRFANYLHKLTKHTQFIMITHRRGTMAAADRLYGITMQEKGVSTLVSVNLIEEQLDA